MKRSLFALSLFLILTSVYIQPQFQVKSTHRNKDPDTGASPQITTPPDISSNSSPDAFPATFHENFDEVSEMALYNHCIDHTSCTLFPCHDNRKGLQVHILELAMINEAIS
jgi:hypothetical protein